jgi:tyrosyl-tRNA synthetase
VLDLAVASGAYASRGEARRGIEQGGLTINGRRVSDPAETPPAPIANEFYVVRVGKKRTLIGRRATPNA